MCGNGHHDHGPSNLHNEVEITIAENGDITIRTGAFDAPVHAAFDGATREVMRAYDAVTTQRLPTTHAHATERTKLGR